MVVPGFWRRADYIDAGYLLSTSDGGDLIAVPGALGDLSGITPEPVLHHVDNGQNNGSSRSAISRDGTLVCSPLVDHSGRVESVSGDARDYNAVNLSPDGLHVVYVTEFDLFVQDLRRGGRVPVASELSNAEDRPVWSPDGKCIIFGAVRDALPEPPPGAGPVQGAMRAVGVERIRAALREAVEPFLLADGGIEIRPNVFTYVVATS